MNHESAARNLFISKRDNESGTWMRVVQKRRLRPLSRVLVAMLMSYSHESDMVNTQMDCLHYHDVCGVG